MFPVAMHFANGKPTFYCRFRGPDGRLLAWRSTGFTSRTAAENWAHYEIKQNRVGTQQNISFGEFAKGWWTEEHSYVQGKRARGVDLSATYLAVQRTCPNRHVLPRFHDVRLSRITPGMLEDRILGLRRKKTSKGGSLSPATVNHCFRTFSIQ